LIASVNRHAESEHEYLDTEVYEFSVADGSLRPLTNRKGPGQFSRCFSQR